MKPQRFRRGGSILALAFLVTVLSITALGQVPAAAATNNLAFTMLGVQSAPDQLPPSLYPVHTGMFEALTLCSLTDRPHGVAFVFDWGDGTTTRDPATGYRYPFSPGEFVLSNAVFHTFPGPGIYTVRLTAMDDLGDTQASMPAVLTLPTP